MPKKRLEDMDALQKENYFRELALKMMSKNILGDESVGDNDEIKFQDASISSIQKTKPIDMPELKKMITKLKINLKNIYSLLPIIYTTFASLRQDREQFMVYETVNYKEVQQVGIKAIERYSELKEALINLLKSPKKTSEVTRTPEVFEKIQNEYNILKNTQAKLNKIIVPVDLVRDYPVLITPRSVKIVNEEIIKKEKLLNNAEKKVEDIIDVENHINALKFLLANEENETERAKIINAIQDMEPDLKRAISNNKKNYENYKKIMIILERLQDELERAKKLEDEKEKEEESEGEKEKEDESEDADELSSEDLLDGEGRRGGLQFKEYIYGRLHWPDKNKYKGEIVYNILSELKDLGDETEKLMKKLGKTIYEGTPAFGYGRKSYSYYGSGYSEFYQDADFVERKFR